MKIEFNLEGEWDPEMDDDDRVHSIADALGRLVPEVAVSLGMSPCQITGEVIAQLIEAMVDNDHAGCARGVLISSMLYVRQMGQAISEAEGAVKQ